MKTYSEKLRDPRWQRKRLEIMQRDDFTCTQCGDSKSTLNVHHWKYNGDPWEADDYDLSTVCEACHEIIEKRKKIRLPTRAGINHRFLNKGETIQEGDQFFSATIMGWIRFGKGVGTKYEIYDSGDMPPEWRLPRARRRLDY
jgi:5-methylcytosine-specific restriction endonuclease McrA